MWWSERFTSFWAYFLSNPDISYTVQNRIMSSIQIWKSIRGILKGDGEHPRILNLCSVIALRLERSTQALLNTKDTSGSKWFCQQGLEDECRTSVACLIAVTLCAYKHYKSKIPNRKTQVCIEVSTFLKNAKGYLHTPQIFLSCPQICQRYLELLGTNSVQVVLPRAFWSSLGSRVAPRNSWEPKCCFLM